MHHNNIPSINLSTTSMGETWKNNLFRECLTFPPGGRKCIFVLFPSMAPENWGRTSQLQLLLITMGRFRISLRSGRSAASVKLQHCHLCPRFLFPGHHLTHPGMFSHILGVLPGDVLSLNTERTCKPWPCRTSQRPSFPSALGPHAFIGTAYSSWQNPSLVSMLIVPIICNWKNKHTCNKVRNPMSVSIPNNIMFMQVILPAIWPSRFLNASAALIYDLLLHPVLWMQLQKKGERNWILIMCLPRVISFVVSFSYVLQA